MRNFHRLLCAFVLVASALLLTGPSLAQPQTVVFGGDLAYPPYEWDENGTAVGFLIEIEDALGWGGAGNSEVVHRLAPWPDTVRALRQGTVDVVPMFRSEKRERSFWFSEPLFFSHHAIFTVDDPGDVTGLSGLSRWRVAVEASSFAHDQLVTSGQSGALVVVGNTQEAVAALAAGQADYAVLSSSPAARLADDLGFRVKRVGTPLWPREYSFAVRNDRPEMISWVETNLGRVISNGQFQAIRDRWEAELEGSSSAAQSRLAHRAWTLLGGASAAVAALMLLFVRVRSRLKRERVKRAQAEQDALFLSEHDPTTRLPRRRRFEAEANLALNRHLKTDLTMVAFKVAGFGETDEVQSQPALNLCLRLIAEELRDECLVSGYLAESTFAALVLADGVHVLLEELLRRLRNMRISVEFVWGGARFPTHGADAKTLLHKAEIAMSTAAVNGRTWLIYDPEMEPTPERAKILREFTAFGKDQLFALYQPQLDLRSGKITAAEALVRWQHPERGVIPPDEFIPQLERAGLIGEVTLRMIDEAVRQSVSFRRRGRPIRFSVNVSAQDFAERNLPELIERTVERFGGRAEDLIVELTESGAVSDSDSVRGVLERLKVIGVGTAIDDFGTGFSSLASFTELAFDELKIDRLFVERMLTSEGHHAAVNAAISMARRMNLTVVAEGAPDLATIELLRHRKCDRVQSYAVSKPLSGESLFDFVSSFTLPTANAAEEKPYLKVVR